MTLLFSQNHIPPQFSTEIFGFIQNEYTPSKFSEYPGKPAKCNLCGCRLFPTNNGQCACPICNPDSDFSSDTIKIGSGYDEINQFMFFFDVLIPKEKVEKLLTVIWEKMKENSKVLIFGLSGHTTILGSRNKTPEFTAISDLTAFKPSEFHFVSKDDLKDVIIPSLSSYYFVFSSTIKDADSQNIILPLKMVIYYRISANLLCFLKRAVDPIPIDVGAKISLSMAKCGIIANFVSKQTFCRLSAISRFTFGTVTGYSEHHLESILQQLLIPNSSNLPSLKVIMPRAFEITKATGADGVVSMKPKSTILKFAAVRGCSAIIERNPGRVGADIKMACILEKATTIFGKFLTVHKLNPIGSEEPSFNPLQQQIQYSIALKCFASDVLKNVFSGERLDECVQTFGRKIQLNKTCLANSGIRNDRDCLILYYVTHAIFREGMFEVTQSKIENGQIIVSPPTIYVYSTDKPENAIKAVSKFGESEWPFEIIVYSNINDFLAIAEKLGIQIIQ